MNIEELTIGEAKKLVAIFNNSAAPVTGFDNGMLGKYVIVRCHDAGVHAGVLKAYDGRSCLLHEARRLWSWCPANKACNLSGVATEGLLENSKLGVPVTIHLTENCEIIECTERAEASIRGLKSHTQD